MTPMEGLAAISLESWDRVLETIVIPTLITAWLRTADPGQHLCIFNMVAGESLEL